MCGEIVEADIGISDEIAYSLHVKVHENSQSDRLALSPEQHKFHRGHAFIWSGPELSTGAARLAAMAAARTGAGLTTILGSREALRIHAGHVSSIMLRQVENLEDLRPVLEDKRKKAFCIGPAAGINDMTRKVAFHMLKTGWPVVLDADALTVFADEPEALFQAIKAVKWRDVVLTPHEGEFARLFKDITGNKIQRAQFAAEISGACIVLKGADTVIAIPSGFASVNTNAPSKLATAGSGDVLAGIITSWLAQGYDDFMSASAGVWQHGEAANRCSKRSIIAEDLIAELGN
jgi:ADP-dependent NAD(P)H-hydrate dehydratase / NAD(P)H-hydrate epimerase